MTPVRRSARKSLGPTLATRKLLEATGYAFSPNPALPQACAAARPTPNPRLHACQAGSELAQPAAIAPPLASGSHTASTTEMGDCKAAEHPLHNHMLASPSQQMEACPRLVTCLMCVLECAGMCRPQAFDRSMFALPFDRHQPLAVHHSIV